MPSPCDTTSRSACDHRVGGSPARWCVVAAVSLVVWASAAAGPARSAEPGAVARAGRPPARAFGTGPGGVPYVDEGTCHGCHPAAAEAWRPSHHARAMQPASPATVLGDFADVRHEQDGETFRFRRRGDRYVVHAAGADGVVRDHVVTHTFGVDPLQQYLVEAPGGRLQVLGVAWDTTARRWIDVYPDERLEPGDAMHWTGRYQSWNAMCADCHSTDLRKRYDPDTDTYATTWSVMSVGCQACHGPGARHVAWADDPRRGKDPTRGLVVEQPRPTAEAEIEACAPCHARRAEISGGHRLYDHLLDDYLPTTLDEGLYWSDGQILDEVYVYGSFRQSRMYAAGVRCTDCHAPHGLGLRAEGNALCTRCHAPEPERTFAGRAAGLFDAPAHHHHPEASAGARCVACHMPDRTYMVVDPRRDHGFRVPRPDLSATLGVPNACTGCHAEEGAGWAAARVREWFGASRRQEAGWAATIHDARLGAPGVAPALAALARAASAPAIVRATAVSLLPGFGEPALGAAVDALGDPDPAVRVRAAAAVAVLPPPRRLGLLLPVLADDVRAVRAEAGRALAGVPEGVLEPDDFARLRRAVAEYESGQRAASDLPTGRINLALLYTDEGRLADAESQYRIAIDQDPRFLPPVANLAQLLAAQGRLDAAESVLLAGIVHMPEEGELHYALGLLLAEQGRLDAAAEALGRAAERMPDRPRVQYNYGLALQRLGRRGRAGEALGRAARADPAEPAYAQALAIHFAQAGRWREALVEARRWQQLAPRDPNAGALVARAEREIAGDGPGAR